MKEHAKKALKHDISVAGKTVPTLAIVALFLVGGGSAAILSSFGTIDGTTEVDQAVTFDDNGTEESFSFPEDSLVAPATYENTVNLENHNEETAVSYNWRVDEDATDTSLDREYDYTVEADNGEQVDVTAEPSMDKVTYTIELPTELSDQSDPDNIDVEFDVDGDGVTDFHVKYQRNGEDSSDFRAGMENFGVATYDGSNYDKWKTVSEVNAVRSVELSDRDGSNGEEVEIVVNKPTEEQSFGIRGDYERDGFTLPESAPVNQGPGFGYASPNTYQDVNVADGVKTGVYEVTSITEQTTDEKSDAETPEPEADVNLTITPSVDTVAYEFDLSEEFEEDTPENINFNIGGSDKEVDYHLKYQPGYQQTNKGDEMKEEFEAGKDHFGVAPDYNKWKTISEVDGVVDASVSQDGKTVTFIVKQNDGQTFKAYGAIEGADADGTDDNHEVFNIGEELAQKTTMTSANTENLVAGETESLDSGESEEFNVVTQFSPAIKPDTYTVDVTASVPQ